MTSSRLTKRALYFAVLWLPAAVLPSALFSRYTFILLYVMPFYLPAAIYLSIRSRKLPTTELLRRSWRVPFVSGVSAGLVWSVMNASDNFTAHHSLQLVAVMTDPKLPLACLIGAGVATGMLAFGWLLLLTIGRSWPLDRGARLWKTAA